MLLSPRERASTLILILGLGILFALGNLLVGMLGAAVLFVICAGPHRWLVGHGVPPSLAAAIVLIGTIALVLVPGALLVGAVIDQVPQTVRQLQESSLLQRLNALGRGRIAIGDELMKASGTALSWLSGQALSVAGSIASAMLNLVVSLFTLYFLLLSETRVWETVREYLPFSNAAADQLRERFYSATRATVLGTLVVAILQGTLIGLGFLIVGLGNPFFWGAVTAIASVIPVVGSALVWLPGVVVLLVEAKYGRAIGLAVIGGVLASNIDNIIRPIVFKRVSDMHPLITLVGAFAGVRALGLLGVLLGPLAIAYFFELLKIYRQEFGSDALPRPAQAPSQTGDALPRPAQAPTQTA